MDFQSDRLFKLHPVDSSEGQKNVGMLLLEGEEILFAFKGVRDMVAFTHLRIITMDAKGITGNKIEYGSIPLKNIVAFSVETVGSIDKDCSLDMWLSGMGRVRLEFGKSADILSIGKWLAAAVLPHGV